MAGIMASMAFDSEEFDDTKILDTLIFEDTILMDDFSSFLDNSREGFKLMLADESNKAFVIMFNGFYPDGQIVVDPTIMFNDDYGSLVLYDKDDLTSLFEFFLVWNARFALNGSYPNLVVRGLFDARETIDTI